MRGIETPSLVDIRNAMEQVGQQAAARAKTAAREEIARRALQLVDAVVVAKAVNNRIQIRRQHNVDPDPGFYQLASPALIPDVGDRIYGVSGGGALILLGVEPGEGYRDLAAVDEAAAVAFSEAEAAAGAASSAGQAAASAATAASSANQNANTRVGKGGDTMTGLLTLPSGTDPTGAHQAAKVKQVEDRVDKGGDTMTGLLNGNGGVAPGGPSNGGVRYIFQGNQTIAAPGALPRWTHSFGDLPNWAGAWQDLGGGVRKPLPVGEAKFGVYVDSWTTSQVWIKNNETVSWGVGAFLWKNA